MATFSRTSIANFKVLTKSTFLDVVRNPKTDKLFLVNQDGTKFIVHQTIDLEKDCEILIIVDDDGVESYSLVNKNLTNVLKTF